MNRTLPVILAAVLVASAATAVLFVSMRQNRTPAPTTPGPAVVVPENIYADLIIPEFSLTDQDGGLVDQTLFEDRITVMDLFFTVCPGPCPGMTAQMSIVQGQTEGTGVRLASISVAGDHDSPEILTAYAERAGADPERWRFLTGDPGTVAAFVRDGLKFGIQRENDNPVLLVDGSTIPNTLHPTKLMLVGPDRRLLYLASYDNPAEVAELVRRARDAAESLGG